MAGNGRGGVGLDGSGLGRLPHRCRRPGRSDLDRRSADHLELRTSTSRWPTIQHLTLECIHHGAEVALVRDLHRVRSGPF